MKRKAIVKNSKPPDWNYDFSRLSPALIASLTGVDPSTARRYLRERNAPQPVLRLLALHIDGWILPAPWRKLSRFEGDFLVIEEAERYTLGQFRARFWQYQLLLNENDTLKARIAGRLAPVVPLRAPVSDSPADQAACARPAPIVLAK